MTTAFHRDVVAGVPVFWAPHPGSLRAALLFRVGQADETLPTRGWTHLVEHLALAAMGREHGEFNGSVEQVHTSFVFAGEPDEVCRALNDVVAALASLPYGRLDVERQILRTEAAGKGSSVVAPLLTLRFGAQSYGLPAYPELGLASAEPARLEDWRRRWFTAGNAVLWLSGPPPDGLDLSPLPPGPGPAPVPEPTIVNGPYPAWYPGAGDNVVAFSVLHDRSMAWACGAQLLTERLRQRLRVAEGLSYTVVSDRSRWGERLGMELFVADALPDRTAAVRDAMLAEVGRLAWQGPSGEELTTCRATARKLLTDPDSGPGHALEAAHGHLRGERRQELDERLAELDALTPAAVTAAVRTALASAL